MSRPAVLLLFLLLAQHVTSFTVLDTSHMIHAALPTTIPDLDVLTAYRHVLMEHPLPTQVATGATLAVIGDAIAQARDKTVAYDQKRAASFAVFDMAYRVLQHYAFPLIVANCHGQILGSIPPFQGNFDPFVLGTLEQTLANQLGIVPFLYYPAFFTLTGVVQGLTPQATLQRAQETFFFLMQRNLLFWIPVQFFQFGFVEEELQIPFVCVAGLAWTCILSILAGSTKSYSTDESMEAEVEGAMAKVAQTSAIQFEGLSTATIPFSQERIETGANATATAM